MDLLDLTEKYLATDILDDYLRLLAQTSLPEKNISSEDIRYAHGAILKLIQRIKNESERFNLSDNFSSLVNQMAAWSDMENHGTALAVVSSINIRKKTFSLVAFFNYSLESYDDLSYNDWVDLENIKIGSGIRLRRFPPDDQSQPTILEATPTSEALPVCLLQVIHGKLGKKLDEKNNQRFIIQDAAGELWIPQKYIKKFDMKPQKSYSIKQVATYNRKTQKYEYQPVAII